VKAEQHLPPGAAVKENRRGPLFTIRDLWQKQLRVNLHAVRCGDHYCLWFDQFIDREIASLTQRINQPEVNETERIELIRRQQELRALKRKPLQALEVPG